MKTVKYVTGADGTEYLLNQSYSINIQECNPWSTNWDVESIEEQFGVTVSSFKKGTKTLQITLKFRGLEDEISNNLNGFFEACEKDIINQKAGRLYVDDEYLEGYFTERETEPSKTFYGYQQTITFLAPYPFWIKEETMDFASGDETEDPDGLDYNYDYDYDYAQSSAGAKYWNNNHYAPSDFLMVVYGAVDDPKININGHTYEVNVQLNDDESMVIDSRNNTIIKIQNNGTIVNIFKLRNTEESVFEKIDGGNVLFTWSGFFNFTVTLFLERSEPSWS